jgi:hypothetical protein
LTVANKEAIKKKRKLEVVGGSEEDSQDYVKFNLNLSFIALKQL